MDLSIDFSPPHQHHLLLIILHHVPIIHQCQTQQQATELLKTTFWSPNLAFLIVIHPLSKTPMPVIASPQQKAILIQKVLTHLYPHPPIPLNHFDNFSFLIAVSSMILAPARLFYSFTMFD